MNKLRLLPCGPLILLFASLNSYAALTGDVRGLVLDPTGGAIANANVTITARDFAVRRTLVTDRSGQFLSTLLPIGPYEIRVDAGGFKTSVDYAVVKSEIRVIAPAPALINTTDPQLTFS